MKLPKGSLTTWGNTYSHLHGHSFGATSTEGHPHPIQTAIDKLKAELEATEKLRRLPKRTRKTKRKKGKK